MISFLIGIFMTYITVPLPEIVIKYPTPYNSIVYKDSSDMCYTYEPQKVDCSGKKLSVIPAQIINNNSINNRNAFRKLYEKNF